MRITRKRRPILIKEFAGFDKEEDRGKLLLWINHTKNCCHVFPTACVCYVAGGRLNTALEVGWEAAEARTRGRRYLRSRVERQ